jgi:hypothetical protein
MESKFKIPTETVELPSKGLLYPKDSPLASGKIEMKYMTAKEEDILTNSNYINKGTVIDKLLESLIVDKNIVYSTLLAGDKNAIMVAARILAYGKEYTFEFKGTQTTVDLSSLENKDLHLDIENCKGINEFHFNLPETGNEITFKLLSHKDDDHIDREVKGLQKLKKDSNPVASTRYKHMITSVNGLRDQKDIREFVDKYFLARDARAFREYYRQLSPDIDLEVQIDGEEGVVNLPITLNFFWPDSAL